MFDERGKVLGTVGGADFQVALGFSDRYMYDCMVCSHAENELVGLGLAWPDKEAAFFALH